MPRARPTTDDYSRFLDDFLLHMVNRIVQADRLGEEEVATALREIQAVFISGRSKRNL